MCFYKRLSGHETVCGQTVSELIDLLGLPDFLDGIVATARGFVCSALSARLQVRDVAEPAALQGYFDTLRQIILKLKELGKKSKVPRILSNLQVHIRAESSRHVKDSFRSLVLLKNADWSILQVLHFQDMRLYADRLYLSWSIFWDNQISLTELSQLLEVSSAVLWVIVFKSEMLLSQPLSRDTLILSGRSFLNSKNWVRNQRSPEFCKSYRFNWELRPLETNRIILYRSCFRLNTDWGIFRE